MAITPKLFVGIKSNFLQSIRTSIRIRKCNKNGGLISEPIFGKNMEEENSLFLLHFLIHIHVLMLCRKFEVIPIKIGFFTNFSSCSKIRSKTLYYSTGSLAKFHEK